MADAADHRFYYLTNFESAMRWLTMRYGDLLNAREHEFIQRFGNLARESKALLVRLIMRRGPLFRESKIVYAEIGCIASAAQPLMDLGWIDPDPETSAVSLAR